jgi:hypothetical protein
VITDTVWDGQNTVILRMFAMLTIPSVEPSHTEISPRSTVMMKDLRQAPGQRTKAQLPQGARLVGRLESAPLLGAARRQLHDGDGQLPIPGAAPAIGEDGILAEPPVPASGLTEALPRGTRGSIGRRLLAAVRAWATAGQLGPDPDTIVGRHTGVRC